MPSLKRLSNFTNQLPTSLLKNLSHTRLQYNLRQSWSYLRIGSRLQMLSMGDVHLICLVILTLNAMLLKSSRQKRL